MKKMYLCNVLMATALVLTLLDTRAVRPTKSSLENVASLSGFTAEALGLPFLIDPIKNMVQVVHLGPQLE